MVAGLRTRKADTFAALLEGKAGPGSLDPALAQLASLTQQLTVLPQPSVAFRSSLRDQLVAAASNPSTITAAAPAAGHATSTIATVSKSALTKSAPLWVKIGTGVGAIAVSATGVGISAHRALPGDLFYGVKRQVESLQLDLADGGRETATTRLGFAHARADELGELIRREGITDGKPISKETAARIQKLLDDWAKEAGAGTSSLLAQIKALGSARTGEELSASLRKTLQSFTSQQFGQLAALLPQLPAGTLKTLTISALGYLQRVDKVVGGDPAALIRKLPVPLSSLPGLTGAGTSGIVPGAPKVSPAPGSRGTGKTSPPAITVPSAIPSLTVPKSVPKPVPKSIPKALPSAIRSTIPKAIPLPTPPAVSKTIPKSLPTALPTAITLPTPLNNLVPSPIASAITGITHGKLPSLPLPTSIPTLPKLPGLG